MDQDARVKERVSQGGVPTHISGDFPYYQTFRIYCSIVHNASFCERRCIPHLGSRRAEHILTDKTVRVRGPIVSCRQARSGVLDYPAGFTSHGVVPEGTTKCHRESLRRVARPGKDMPASLSRIGGPVKAT